MEFVLLFESDLKLLTEFLADAKEKLQLSREMGGERLDEAWDVLTEVCVCILEPLNKGHLGNVEVSFIQRCPLLGGSKYTNVLEPKREGERERRERKGEREREKEREREQREKRRERERRREREKERERERECKRERTLFSYRHRDSHTCYQCFSLSPIATIETLPVKTPYDIC